VSYLSKPYSVKQLRQLLLSVLHPPFIQNLAPIYRLPSLCGIQDPGFDQILRELEDDAIAALRG
jgi:hypothetical protein